MKKRYKGESLYFWTSLFFPLFGFPMYKWILVPKSNIKEQEFIEAYQDHVKYSIQRDMLLPDEDDHLRMVEHNLQLQPYINIFSKKDAIDEKIRAINELGQKRNPDSVRLLKIAKEDASPEVNYIAATALIKIEKPIQDDLADLQQKVKVEPEEASYWSRLGAICYDYCHLGLLDEVNRRFYLEQAHQAYLKVLELNYSRLDTFLELSKVLIFLGQGQEAKPYLEHYMREKAEDPNGYIWMSEALFLSYDKKGLREFLQQTLQKFPNHNTLRRMYEVWL